MATPKWYFRIGPDSSEGEGWRWRLWRGDDLIATSPERFDSKGLAEGAAREELAEFKHAELRS